jgi:hypothetical protein
MDGFVIFRLCLNGWFCDIQTVTVSESGLKHRCVPRAFCRCSL